MIKNKILKMGAIAGLVVTGFMSSSFGGWSVTEIDQNVRALYKNENADELLELIRNKDNMARFTTRASESNLPWWSQNIGELNEKAPLFVFKLARAFLKSSSSVFNSFNQKDLTSSAESRESLFWFEISGFLSQLVENKIKRHETSFGVDILTFVQQVEISEIQFEKWSLFYEILAHLNEKQRGIFIGSMNALISATIEKNKNEEEFKSIMCFDLKMEKSLNDVLQLMTENEKILYNSDEQKSHEEVKELAKNTRENLTQIKEESGKITSKLSLQGPYVFQVIQNTRDLIYYRYWLNIFNVLSDHINL